MKQIIPLLCSLLVIFGGCDDRGDFSKNLNKSPEILIAPADSIFYTYSSQRYDTIKTTKVDTARYYYKVSDETNLIPTVEFPTTSISYSIDTAKKLITFYGFSLGTYSALISVKDPFGVKSSAKVAFEAYINRSPIASFVYFKQALLDPLEYVITANQSFDPDAKFGGGITNYQFKINNTYVVNTPNNGIVYIFPSPGNYTISLIVTDNDNTNSFDYTIVANIN